MSYIARLLIYAKVPHEENSAFNFWVARGNLTPIEVNAESEGCEVSSGVDGVIQYIDENLDEVKDVSKFLDDLHVFINLPV